MDGPEYFTPPMADMAAQTQPGLWDGIDLSEFNAARATQIDRMQPADRMLLMLSRKDLTPTARIVGAALAYHGWVSWPSLDTLADLLNIDKRHLSRPVHDLVDHGYARRSKRSGARGSVSTQYVFSGLAILNALDSDEAGELSKRVRIARGRDHQNGDDARFPDTTGRCGWAAAPLPAAWRQPTGSSMTSRVRWVQPPDPGIRSGSPGFAWPSSSAIRRCNRSITACNSAMMAISTSRSTVVRSTSVSMLLRSPKW